MASPVFAESLRLNNIHGCTIISNNGKTIKSDKWGWAMIDVAPRENLIFTARIQYGLVPEGQDANQTFGVAPPDWREIWLSEKGTFGIGGERQVIRDGRYTQDGAHVFFGNQIFRITLDWGAAKLAVALEGSSEISFCNVPQNAVPVIGVYKSEATILESKVLAKESVAQSIGPTVSPISASLPTEQVPTTLGRVNDDIDAVEVSYKPLANFVKDFSPTKGPQEYLRDETLHVENIRQHTGPYITQLVAEGVAVMRDKVDNHRVLQLNPGLTEDGVFAMAVFTLELQSFVLAADENSEFYFQYGVALRLRQPGTMRKLAGYSHFLFVGLLAMPEFVGTLWRGLGGADAVQKVTENYTEGKQIHWSAFSSGTPDRKMAKQFMTESGIMLKIKVRNCARDIRACSAMPSEDERLILPNTKFVISEAAHRAPDGIVEVHMVEVSGHFTF